MNKAQHVAALVGSKAELARVINRDRAIVSRMIKTGVVPWHFNSVLMQWAAERGCEDEMSALLEPTCPTCGQGLTAHQH